MASRFSSLLAEGLPAKSSKSKTHLRRSAKRTVIGLTESYFSNNNSPSSWLSLQFRPMAATPDAWVDNMSDPAALTTEHQHLVYKSGIAGGNERTLFLGIHVIDGRPALRRISGVHRRIIPIHVVIGIVTVLAKEIEPQHALLLLIGIFVGGRLVRIHELEELRLSPVWIFLVGVLATGAVATFTSYILQVWSCCIIPIAGQIFEAGYVA